MPRIRAHGKLYVSIFIAFALIACSDGGGRGSLARLGIDDGASEGLTKSATVSAEKGGTIALGTGAKVEIPGGAVSASVQVSMERPADGKALDLVNRLPKAADRIASAPYVLTPHGTKFEEDVTVTLPISNKDAQDVSVAWLEDEDDQVWKVLSEATVEGETAQVKIKHFSVLLLVHDITGLARLDAGTGSEERDAGDVEIDSGAETRDAEAPAEDAEVSAELDADVMVESDAGTSAMDAGPDVADASSGGSDAGADTLDASTGGPDASAPADADPGTDASQLPDGSVSVDGAVVATTLQQRLTDCDLITTQGFVSEPVTPDPVTRCRYRCVLAGQCQDVQGFYCLGGDTSYSVDTQNCMLSCEPTFFVCPNQLQGNFHCDGDLDCPDGEDEAGCDPPYFQCQAGNRLSAYQRCDRVPDCASGEDELGCSWHACDGDAVLPPDVVCDGFAQCSDGSDEPASCASVNCSIITAQ